MTGRGFRCGNGEMGRNTSVILPAEHRRPEAPTSCDKVSQRRPVNLPARRRRPAPSGSLTLSSPTALLSSAPEWQAQFYKTKLCPFYVRDIPDALSAQQVAAQFGHNVGSASGVCMNRDNCRFAHSFEELRPLPDLRKTKLCSSYTKKTPCKNPKCPFAHSPNELRTSSSVFYKVTLCNFYKNGRCWNGSNCRFAHGNEELRLAEQQQTSDEDDELVSTTTTSTRTKKVRRPCSREKPDGLLPTPADSTRLPYEKPLHKVRTAASTTSNSASTSPPPGTAPQSQAPPQTFPDTETLISLVTQKLLEPQPPANVFEAPAETIPPGFAEVPASPSSLNVDAETLMSFLLAASTTNVTADDDHYLPQNHDLFPPQSHYRPPQEIEHQPLYRTTPDTVYPNTYVPPTGIEALSHQPLPGMMAPPPPSDSFPVINGPACSFVPEVPDIPEYENDNADDPTVRLLISLLQGMTIDDNHSFV